MNIFPFTLYCDRKHGGVPDGFYRTWLSVKPEDLLWYGVDITIQSPTRLDYTVYDMDSFVYGGVGRVIHRGSTTVDTSVTREAIEAYARVLAKYQRERELQYQEEQLIDQYAQAILANLDKDTPCP